MGNYFSNRSNDYTRDKLLSMKRSKAEVSLYNSTVLDRGVLKNDYAVQVGTNVDKPSPRTNEDPAVTTAALSDVVSPASLLCHPNDSEFSKLGAASVRSTVCSVSLSATFFCRNVDSVVYRLPGVFEALLRHR